MGGGEPSVVMLHPGDQMVPKLYASNCLVLIHVRLSLLLITLPKVLLNVSATPPQPAFAVFEGFYGEGNGDVVHVTCAGTERRLADCMVSYDQMCSHSQDGGAICAGILVHQ